MKKLFLFLFLAGICAGAAELPKRFTVVSGDLKVDVSKESFWNISGARYRGKIVARPTSWYGTVTAGQSGLKGWIGSGHMENGIGEKNLKVTFKVDGKEWTPVAGEVSAGCFEIERESDLGHMHLKATVKISGDTISEHVWTNMNKASMILIYHFMYAWNTPYSEYAFRSADGKVSEGKFAGKKDNLYFPVPEKFGVYSAADSVGAVVALKSVAPMGDDAEIRIHDLPYFYKFYFVPTTRARKKLVPGKTYEYAAEVKFFSGSREDFINKITK